MKQLVVKALCAALLACCAGLGFTAVEVAHAHDRSFAHPSQANPPPTSDHLRDREVANNTLAGAFKRLIDQLFGSAVFQAVRGVITALIVIMIVIRVGVDMANAVMGQLGLTVGFLFGDSRAHADEQFAPTLPILVLSLISRLVFALMLGILINSAESIVGMLASIFSR